MFYYMVTVLYLDVKRCDKRKLMANLGPDYKKIVESYVMTNLVGQI